jgi:hypothetical protein
MTSRRSEEGIGMERDMNDDLRREGSRKDDQNIA